MIMIIKAPMSTLQDIVYTKLDNQTSCATATITPPSINTIRQSLWSYSIQPLRCFTPLFYTDNFTAALFCYVNDNHHNVLSAPQRASIKRQQQRYGVRLLLQFMLAHIGINDTLNDTCYPYRLVNNGDYICFSHSDNKVAVVISKRQPAGIDIETHPVKWHVAQRFFHPEEIEILEKLNSNQRDIIIKWLWQLKESQIKIYQYTLAQGLGISYATIIPKIHQALEEPQSHNHNYIPIINTASNRHTTHNHIAMLATQQTLIVF